jgi:hypothetical protein
VKAVLQEPRLLARAAVGLAAEQPVELPFEAHLPGALAVG